MIRALLTAAERAWLRALFEREAVLRRELRHVRAEQDAVLRALCGRGVRLLDIARAVAPALGCGRRVEDLVRLRDRLRKRLRRSAADGSSSHPPVTRSRSAPSDHTLRPGGDHMARKLVRRTIEEEWLEDAVEADRGLSGTDAPDLEPDDTDDTDDDDDGVDE